MKKVIEEIITILFITKEKLSIVNVFTNNMIKHKVITVYKKRNILQVKDKKY